MTTKPWHGVLVATPAFWDADNQPDYAAYATHVKWLADNGCHGVIPNGSLGEYQLLSQDQRDEMVRVAVASVPSNTTVMPGIAAYGAIEARRHAEFAAEAGCQVGMLLPPNAYRGNRAEAVEHYRVVAEAGLPLVAYNNPYDTKFDLDPTLLAELFHEGYIVGVKEFSRDVRRTYEILELAPGLDVLAGSDDVSVEFAIAGATGWVSGYPNVFPATSVELWESASSGDLETAMRIYKALHPLLRWDSKPELVQAIKLSMDVTPGVVNGGHVLLPRMPLSESAAATVVALTNQAYADGFR